MNQLKRIQLLFVFLLLTGVGAFFSLQKNTETSSFKKEEISLAVGDTMGIEAIKIQRPSQAAVNLHKISLNEWRVNNKFEVRNQLVSFLFYGLNKLEVKRPISDNQKGLVKKELLADGIKVSIRKGEKEETFIVKTNENDINSSYFLPSGSDDPVIVHVPGVKGDISQLLNLKEEDWRTRELFNSSPLSLKKVSLNYTEHKEDNFEVVSENSGFLVKGVENQDTLKVKKYLEMFGYLNVDKFIVEKKDSIEKVLSVSKPYATLTIQDIHPEKSKQLIIYRLSGEQNLIGKIVNTNEVVTLNPKIYKFVFVRKSHFQKRTE